MTFMLRVRRKVEVNTDPQRRCYNGCHASSEMQWSLGRHFLHVMTRRLWKRQWLYFKGPIQQMNTR